MPCWPSSSPSLRARRVSSGVSTWPSGRSTRRGRRCMAATPAVGSGCFSSAGASRTAAATPDAAARRSSWRGNRPKWRARTPSPSTRPTCWGSSRSRRRALRGTSVRWPWHALRPTRWRAAGSGRSRATWDGPVTPRAMTTARSCSSSSHATNGCPTGGTGAHGSPGGRSRGACARVATSTRRSARSSCCSTSWTASARRTGTSSRSSGSALLALDRADEARPYLARAWSLLANDAGLRADEPERLARLRALGLGEDAQTEP